LKERFEGFRTSVFVQQAFPFFRIRLSGEEFVASFTEVRDPFLVFRAELILELFSEALGKGRASPGRRYGDLQISALHDVAATTRNIPSRSSS
jgi:hypothetical protein